MNSVFTLEQQILSCWGVTDDIQVLIRQMDRRSLTEDEQMNFLIGIVTIYNQKFEQMFETFENLVHKKAF